MLGVRVLLRGEDRVSFVRVVCGRAYQCTHCSHSPFARYPEEMNLNKVVFGERRRCRSNLVAITVPRFLGRPGRGPRWLDSAGHGRAPDRPETQITKMRPRRFRSCVFPLITMLAFLLACLCGPTHHFIGVRVISANQSGYIVTITQVQNSDT